MLEAGRFATINELAATEKINSSYVSRVLRLTLLAPDIVEVILDGRQAEGMTLPGLIEPFPVEWDRQRIAVARQSVAEPLLTVPPNPALCSCRLAADSTRGPSRIPPGWL
jgi:hypothetical protein